MSEDKESKHEHNESQDIEVSSSQEERDPWTESQAKTEDEVVLQENKTAEKVASQEEPKPKKQKQEKDTPDLSKDDWERDLINRLAFSAINEQRRTRRWNIFFKSAFFLYLLGILALYLPKESGEIHLGPHTAMVELSGPIADNAFASANTIITGLRNAFKDKNTKGVILRINSPGGSPVHAGYINDEIERLRKKHPNVPLYAVVTDICASAAYYIAAAADEIYADKASIVGSIGVIMDGYGFVEAMEKLGIERRVMTAGNNKAFLDPFSPMKDEHKKHMQGLLDNVHQQFIAEVKAGRGERLQDNPDLFSGLVWSGDKSMELGLIDGLGNLSHVAREVIGQEKIVDFTPRPDYLDRFAERLGVAFADTMSSILNIQGGLK